MPKCPVCKSDHTADATSCSVCGFTELHVEFVNVEEARAWEKTILRPCRAIWAKTMPFGTISDDFEIQAGHLVKYSGHQQVVVVPNGVSCVDDLAFMNNEAIECIVFQEGLLSIGDLAFLGCRNLVSVLLPHSLLTIGEGCFAATGLCRLYVHENVKTIKNRAFPKNMKEIVVDPNNRFFKNIESSPGLFSKDGKKMLFCPFEFDWSKYEEENLIPDGVEILEENLFGYLPDSISDITMPLSLKEIGANVFSWNHGHIDSVYFPPNLESIGRDAFKHLKIGTVYLPRKTFVADDAFHQQNPPRIIRYDRVERNATFVIRRE